MRVAVEFGKSKIYTGLVYKIHEEEPEAYEAKEIHQILDAVPLVNAIQLRHWEWIASYYMCALGEVYRAALPSAFLLESETLIKKTVEIKDESAFSDDEFLIIEALNYQSQLTVNQVVEILGRKTVFPVIRDLIEKKAVIVKEQIYEQYSPKLINYVRLAKEWEGQERLEELLTLLSRAKKQREALLSYFQLISKENPLKLETLKTYSGISSAVIKGLVDRGVFELFKIRQDRINFDGIINKIKDLTEDQKAAYSAIESKFNSNSVVLLKGITSSGKTEIYVKLIKKILEEGKQVLYMLPEIALTTQLIGRLQEYFGDYLSVFHSKYSMNERVEVWNNILGSNKKSQLIVGARSSLFLPFSNLGLIVVDEEHEPSFKQYDPAPRYHARDSAIVLAGMHKAQVLLGSATPSLESYYNAINGKYGLVELNRRYGDVMLPEIELIDIKEKHRKRRMNGHFSDRLIQLINEALDNKEQVILFQNRRGFAPVVECETCGNSPQCPDCDVSLTFHSFKNELRCHYCGHRRAVPYNCGACGSEKLNTKGFGTEQIEVELGSLFPDASIGRMDLDTTRGKYGYQKILGRFQSHEIDILVGTQMLSKGLDFSNVSLVGIMNADNLLNFPDFRAHERSYQLMVQVSGRAGRAHKRGKVAIQTFNPYHKILQQVSTNSYEEMYKEQLDERWQYRYPPFHRLIKITLRHKNYDVVDKGAIWLGKSLTNTFGDMLLGPTIPAIARIRGRYIRTLMVKIPQDKNLKQTKQQLFKIKNAFQAIVEFRAIRLSIDVDNL